MVVKSTLIEGLLILEPRIFEDSRGYFLESYNANLFNQVVGQNINFVQDNTSLSRKGVLRGLHFQNPPYAQGKLVKVTSGAVLDVAVDIRKNSRTYGHWHMELLSAANNKTMWIPEGFAHGFMTLEDNTLFSYKCTKYYAPEHERCLVWNDPDLSISWGDNKKIISQKDEQGEKFNSFTSPF